MKRRRFLTTLGVTGLPILAGCSTSSEQTDTHSSMTTPVVPSLSGSSPTSKGSTTPTVSSKGSGNTLQDSDNEGTAIETAAGENVDSDDDESSQSEGEEDGSGGGDEGGGGSGGSDSDKGSDDGGGGTNGGGNVPTTPTETSESDTKIVKVTGAGAALYNNDTTVRYIVETSGTIEPSTNGDLESEDVAGKSTVAGWVPDDGSDSDTYVLTDGDLVDVSTWGGDVVVTVDGNAWSD